MEGSFAPVITLYEVDLTLVGNNEKAVEHSVSYYARKDDAMHQALILCKPWLENPWRYLVTTSDDPNVRIYDKYTDEVHAIIFIQEHHYVEVG